MGRAVNKCFTRAPSHFFRGLEWLWEQNAHLTQMGLRWGPRKEMLGLVSSFPPAARDRQDVINKTTLPKKPPFKSYHFPCLFHVVRKGWGSSLHIQDLKNKPIEQHPECYSAQTLSRLLGFLFFRNFLSLRKQKRRRSPGPEQSPSSRAAVPRPFPRPSPGPPSSCPLLIRSFV